MPTCRQIAATIGLQTGISTEFIDDISWQEREILLDRGDIHLGWICGLPYTRKVDIQHIPIELLGAPVMDLPRYNHQPVYFSDVIVRNESQYKGFSDLRGATWAYNEPNSQSGYNLTRYHLASIGEPEGFFSRAVEAGSHLRAIDMVLAGEIDASAIDSTVLDIEYVTRPGLEKQLRVIETLGPSPIPPWVISTHLPVEFRQLIREVFLTMHETRQGQAILNAGQIEKMVKVSDQDYDPIREMARKAQGVLFTHTTRKTQP